MQAEEDPVLEHRGRRSRSSAVSSELAADRQLLAGEHPVAQQGEVDEKASASAGIGRQRLGYADDLVQERRRRDHEYEARTRRPPRNARGRRSVLLMARAVGIEPSRSPTAARARMTRAVCRGRQRLRQVRDAQPDRAADGRRLHRVRQRARRPHRRARGARGRLRRGRAVAGARPRRPARSAAPTSPPRSSTRRAAAPRQPGSRSRSGRPDRGLASPAADAAELVVCCEVLEHVHDPSAGLETLVALARPWLIAERPARAAVAGAEPRPGQVRVRPRQHPGPPQPLVAERASSSSSAERVEIVEARRPLPWTMVLCRSVRG